MKKIQISDIRINVEAAASSGIDCCVENEIKKRLNTDQYQYHGLLRKSIDARRKSNIYYEVTAAVSVEDSFKTGQLLHVEDSNDFQPDRIIPGTFKLQSNIIIAGAGPCGLFAALLLSRYGYHPVIIERGDDIDNRELKTRKFWVDGVLDTESNVQFGEGGAGTFSDGKLVTRVKDKRSGYVINTFAEFGADKAITYETKPHIGTDKLKIIIKNIRSEIIKNGGTFLFNSKMTDIELKDHKVISITVNDQDEMKCDALILATGHSARDTYEMLFKKGILMIQKSFSMGVRIEHLRNDVNHVQYGDKARYIKESAEYFLSAKINQRSAYTFCMCPGGVVVNAASEENSVVTNGMSFSKRNGSNSNSAWVVNVDPADFHDSHPLSGIRLQREIEQKSFLMGGSDYSLPVQKLNDFLKGEKTRKLGKITPSIAGNYRYGNLNEALPSFISDTLKKSLPMFNNKMNFFNDRDAILSGCETRTSSPVRIMRDEYGRSLEYSNLFPGGEGAGYAGGITSAAIDGLKLAEQIIRTFTTD
ncbi:MAG: FAD-dependent oxidoreductase [Clostridia bacterium]|nr:FAD-dependent oxidoreductase [Clostridia bacterium]